MYRLRKCSITAIPFAIVLAHSTIIAGMVFPYAASAATLGAGSTVYSRAYSTGGSGNVLPDVAHVIDLVISPLEPVWRAAGGPMDGSGGGVTIPTEQTKRSSPTGDFRNIIPSIIALLLSSYIATVLVRRRKHE